MMRADAGFHADQARRHIGKAAPDLATRPFLAQHNGTTLFVAHDVERILADIDTNHGNCSVHCLGHGVLLVLTPLPASIAGGAGARPDHPINGRSAGSISEAGWEQFSLAVPSQCARL